MKALEKELAAWTKKQEKKKKKEQTPPHAKATNGNPRSHP